MTNQSTIPRGMRGDGVDIGSMQQDGGFLAQDELGKGGNVSWGGSHGEASLLLHYKLFPLDDSLYKSCDCGGSDLHTQIFPPGESCPPLGLNQNGAKSLALKFSLLEEPSHRCLTTNNVLPTMLYRFDGHPPAPV